jgi:ribonucleoside-diphosphate reductase alpha chain
VNRQFFKTDLAYQNWKSKYQYGEETPLQSMMRAAKALASVETENQDYWYERFLNTLVKFEAVETNLDNYLPDEQVVVKAYGKPVGLKTTLGGRILANIGTEYSGTTLLNCFINGPVSNAKIVYQRKVPNLGYDLTVEKQTQNNPDSLANIMLTLLEQAETLKSEGGWGINFDWIRPRGSLIEGIGIEHPGVLKYMEIFDKTSEVIVQGNNDGYLDKLVNYLDTDVKTAQRIGKKVKKMARKGAMMGVLSIWHPDIEEFVRAKQTPGRLTKFNISVMVDDKFMYAVKNNDYYDLHFNGEVHKRVKALDLYNLIMESTYNRAEPGVLFYDNMQKNNPLAYLGDLNATNPCGEIGGNPLTSTVCLLGSINLTQYIQPDRTFDFNTYTQDIETFARMLDNVNDLTYAPLPQYEWATKNVRQYGMGINGFASALYMMGIPYSSTEATEFADRVTWLKEEWTWRTSALLAKEKSTFPAYRKDAFENTYWFTTFTNISEHTKDLIKMHGVRNGKTTTNPPLGNSSVISDNISNGLEPVFSKQYTRTYIAEKWPENLTIENVKTILDEIKVGDATAWQGNYNGETYYYEPHNRGLCKVELVRDYGYEWVINNYVSEQSANYLETAETLAVDDHVRIQEIFQRNCNQSISKTVNVPFEYSFNDFKNAYMSAWERGLNGFTTYRSGTMEAVLTAVEENKEDNVSQVEQIVKKDIKLPDEFINGPMKVIKKEGKKFYINFSYLPEDVSKEFPIALWIQTNSDGEVKQANQAVKKLADLLRKYEISEELIDKQIEKIKGNPAHMRLGKMVSMCLRHNLPLSSVVAALNSLDEVYVTDLLFAVKKFLSEHIEDGTVITGMVCPVCGSTNIVFQSGCFVCLDCGFSGCG